METLFLIGYILASSLLAVIVYRVKVLGFKSSFHKITEFVGSEKNLLFEINSFCLVLSSLLAPIILIAYPSLVELFPEVFGTTKILLLNIIAFIFYIAAMFAGFYFLIYVLHMIWKSRKDKKKSN